MNSTRKQMMQLGMANVIDALLRFLVPILLVRMLSQDDYGYYRYFWLLTSTVMIFAPMGMCRSLLYFLPRSPDKEVKGAFVSQTLLYLAFAGLVAAYLVSPWNPLLPEKFQNLGGHALLMPGFIVLWVVSSLIDFLSSAEQNIARQSMLTVLLSTSRGLVVVGAMYFTRDVEMVYLALFFFAVLKFALVGYYYLTTYGFRLLNLEMERLREQFRYAVPFGLTGTINKLRKRVELWIVALYFVPSEFAVFSVVVSISMLLATARKTIGNVIMPKMSRMESRGNIDQVLLLNSKSNTVIASLLFPLTAFIAVFSEPIVRFLYTDAYSAAAPVLALYALGLAILSIEMGTVLMILKQGRYVLRISAMLVVLSVVLTYIGAQLFGLIGVAAGSVIGILLNNILYFGRVKYLLGVGWKGLQDWRSLLVLAVVSVVAAALSHVFVVEFASVDGVFYRVLAGGTVFSVLYLSILAVTGYSWILLSFLGKRQWQSTKRA